MWFWYASGQTQRQTDIHTYTRWSPILRAPNGNEAIIIITYSGMADSLEHRVRQQPSRSTGVTSCWGWLSIRWRTRLNCCQDAGRSTRLESRSTRTDRHIVPASARSTNTTLAPRRPSRYHQNLQHQHQQQLKTLSNLPHCNLLLNLEFSPS